MNELSSLASLRNIGKEMKRKLNAVGIENAEQLAKIGSKETYFRLKNAYPEVCLVHLYSLQGAVENIDINMLLDDTKKDLKAFSDGLQ